MIYVNNNNKDVKIFKKVDIYISNNDLNYQHILTYESNEEQRQKIDAFAAVIDIGASGAKYLKLKFVKDGNWLMISEIVFAIDLLPFTGYISPPTFGTPLNTVSTPPLLTSRPTKENNDRKQKDDSGKFFVHPSVLVIFFF